MLTDGHDEAFRNAAPVLGCDAVSLGHIQANLNLQEQTLNSTIKFSRTTVHRQMS